MGSDLSRDQYDSAKALSYGSSARLIRQPGHTLLAIVFGEQLAKRFTGILTSTIRMNNETRSWLATQDRPTKCRYNQFVFHVVVQMPAASAVRPQSVATTSPST